jgi:hypothetical protein
MRDAESRTAPLLLPLPLPPLLAPSLPALCIATFSRVFALSTPIPPPAPPEFNTLEWWFTTLGVRACACMCVERGVLGAKERWWYGLASAVLAAAPPYLYRSAIHISKKSAKAALVIQLRADERTLSRRSFMGVVLVGVLNGNLAGELRILQNVAPNHFTDFDGVGSRIQHFPHILKLSPCHR